MISGPLTTLPDVRNCILVTKSTLPDIRNCNLVTIVYD
jgi:hypothetical protein